MTRPLVAATYHVSTSAALSWEMPYVQDGHIVRVIVLGVVVLGAPLFSVQASRTVCRAPVSRKNLDTIYNQLVECFFVQV